MMIVYLFFICKLPLHYSLYQILYCYFKVRGNCAVIFSIETSVLCITKVRMLNSRRIFKQKNYYKLNTAIENYEAWMKLKNYFDLQIVTN